MRKPVEKSLKQAKERNSFKNIWYTMLRKYRCSRGA